MEKITIKDKNTTSIVYIDNNTISGYQEKNNQITEIDETIFNYFHLFKLSNDYTNIGKYDKYEILLDNKTGLKHYYYDNIDNLELLFKNNGRELTLYSGIHETIEDKQNNKKIFNIGRIIIVITLAGLIFINSGLAKTMKIDNNYKNNITYEVIDDLTIQDIKDLIYSSPHLTPEEKDYIYNPEFINQVINSINTSNYQKHEIKTALTDLTISSYEISYDKDEKTSGYYHMNTPNTIYIKNYNGLNANNKDTLAHEIVHLFQDTYSYSFLTEATAEIISQEFFKSTIISGYKEQVYLTKLLMETIGPDPIWNYVFSGNFSFIEDIVKPHLTKAEYREFLNDLSYDYHDDAINDERCQSLKALIKKLYQSIYNEDISNNETITHIEDNTIVRYYFNQLFINEENSYYLDYNECPYTTMSYKEAIDNQTIIICALKQNSDDYKILTYHEYVSDKYKEYDIYFLYDKNIIFNDNNVSVPTPKKIYIPPINQKVKTLTKNSN